MTDAPGPPPATAEPAPSTAAAAAAPPPWSLWSIASMVCATLLVPPFCLLAPLLGLAGLSEAKYKRYRGGRLAVGGIALGFIATIGWATVAIRVAASTRPLILEGPVATLNAGLAGDVAAFRDGFWGEAAESASDAEAEAFLAALQSRHGRVMASQQAAEQDASDRDPVEDGLARIRYEMQFDRGAAAVDTVFVQHAPGRPLPWVLRWKSIEVIDPSGPNLRFPPAPAADAAPDGPPEQLQPPEDAADADPLPTPGG